MKAVIFTFLLINVPTGLFLAFTLPVRISTLFNKTVCKKLDNYVPLYVGLVLLLVTDIMEIVTSATEPGIIPAKVR